MDVFIRIHLFFRHGLHGFHGLTRFVIQTTEGRKNLGNTMVGVNVDVLEILRFALNDNIKTKMVKVQPEHQTDYYP